ncbi:MAG: TIM barrel protein [Clostridia bacterium]
MANFIFSAFADEISASFDEQLQGLKKLDIPYIELRGVDGKSFVELSDDEIGEVAQKLKKFNIKVWSLGSPIGKIKTDGDFELHKKLLNRIMDIGDVLGVKRVRIFSFYPEKNISDAQFEKKSFDMLDELLKMAENRGFILCHENEKDIYGFSVPRVKKLASHFDGRLRVVLDNGNFQFCGESAENAYFELKPYIEYLHIKDADIDGAIVPPGKGKAFIAETLAKINSDRSGDVVITMEPHLMDFAGLSSLSNLDDIKHKYTYDTPFSAFEFATDAVRQMLKVL